RTVRTRLGCASANPAPPDVSRYRGQCWRNRPVAVAALGPPASPAGPARWPAHPHWPASPPPAATLPARRRAHHHCAALAVPQPPAVGPSVRSRSPVVTVLFPVCTRRGCGLSGATCPPNVQIAQRIDLVEDHYRSTVQIQQRQEAGDHLANTCTV